MDCSAVKCILIDIEGTITSISFVQEILFPYVEKNLTSYLETNWDSEEVKTDVAELKKQASKDQEDGVDGVVPIEEGGNERSSVEKNVLWNMSVDRKTTALKQLQGHMWRAGYEDEKIKGHLYSDVADVLRSWKSGGRRLFIYSSGSVEAQKLLIKYSESGDLSDLIEGNFDTKVGIKIESDSYKTIAQKLGVSPEEILFLTDVAAEAEAANEAGVKVAIVIREGNAPLTEEISQKYYTVNSLADLSIESCAKRAKLSNDEVISKESEEKAVTPMETVREDEPMDIDAKKTPSLNHETQQTEEMKTDKTVPEETEQKSTEKVESTDSTEKEDKETNSSDNIVSTENGKDVKATEEVENISTNITEIPISIEKTEAIKIEEKAENSSPAKVEDEATNGIKNSIHESIEETKEDEKVEVESSNKIDSTPPAEKATVESIDIIENSTPAEKVDGANSEKNVEAITSENGDVKEEKTEEETTAVIEPTTNENGKETSVPEKLVGTETTEPLKEAHLDEPEQKQEKISKENGAKGEELKENKDEWNKENAVNGKLADVSNNDSAAPIIEVAAE